MDTRRRISCVVIIVSLICGISGHCMTQERLEPNDLWETVIAISPEIVKARIDLQQAQAALEAAQAQTGFSLVVDTNVQKKGTNPDQLTGMLTISGDLGTDIVASYQLVANWDIKAGSHDYRRLMQIARPLFSNSQSLALKQVINQARYDVEQKKIILAQVTQAVCFQVIEIVLETQYIQQMQAMLDLQINMFQEKITTLTKQLQNQMMTQNDYELLLLELSGLELEAQTTHNRYLQNYNYLLLTYGIDFDQVSTIDMESLELLASKTLLSNVAANVELCQLDYDYALYQLELMSRSRLAGELVANIDQDRNWTCAIAVSYPLYDNGQEQLSRIIADQNVAQTKLALTAALANYEQEQIQSLQEVVYASQRYQLALKRLTLTANQLEIVADRMSYGVVSVSEHSAALKEYQIAQLDLNKANNDLLLSRLKQSCYK